MFCALWYIWHVQVGDYTTQFITQKITGSMQKLDYYTWRYFWEGRDFSGKFGSINYFKNLRAYDFSIIARIFLNF